MVVLCECRLTSARHFMVHSNAVHSYSSLFASLIILGNNLPDLSHSHQCFRFLDLVQPSIVLFIIDQHPLHECHS